MGYIDKRKIQHHIALFVLIISAGFYSASSLAEDYWWTPSSGPFANKKFSSPQVACSDWAAAMGRVSGLAVGTSDTGRQCRGYYKNGNFNLLGPVLRRGDSCTDPAVYNSQTGECEAPEPDECNPITQACLARAEKGSPDFCPSSYAGNPINFAVGNKFQKDTDYQASGSSVLKLSRSYNSIDGLWRHNYSTLVRTADDSQTVVLTMASGKESFFTNTGDSVTTASADIGVLSKISTGWLFVSSDNERFTFDTSGKLTQWSNTQGAVHHLTYSGNQVTVTDNLGNSLTFTEDSNCQPLSLTAPGVQITYNYNANNRLTSVNRTVGGQTTQRHYHYEVPDKPDLLTGITDERGIRYATWAYDDQGRAISSEHANGADRVSVAYNSDGTVSVTNELGKVAKYSFQTIRGVRRITAVEGEPSPNCPSSNSSFTYDDHGLLKTKTDNKGNVTTYDYNKRGLEVSRTEASGTPQARTITTQWHPDWFLPTAVTELGRTIQYSYDNQGRQTSLSVIQAIP